MKCGHCQADNKDGAKFCAKCGATLSASTSSSAPTSTTTSITEETKACPSCNKILKQNAKFCSGCGYDFHHVAVPDEPIIKPEPNLVRPKPNSLLPEQAEEPIQKKSVPKETKPCPNCGKELKVDAKFCGGCGYNFQQEVPVIQVSPGQPEVEPVSSVIKPIQPEPARDAAGSESIREVVRPKNPDNAVDSTNQLKKRPPIAVLGGIAVVAAILIGGGAFYFKSHQSTKQDNQPREIEQTPPASSSASAAVPAPAKPAESAIPAPTPTTASAVAPAPLPMSPSLQNVPASNLENKKKPKLPKKEETNADRKLLNAIDQYMDQKTKGK